MDEASGSAEQSASPGQASREEAHPEQASPEEASPRRWRPLDPRQRRVLGVLVEKAKTTPDSYPMTLNAVTTASNQKSNRSPQMNLDPDDVELTLDELREMGAVVEVQGGGRAAKYKHLLYEWLGVDKVELAVMAELLLRGHQTLGELRGRAARMEPIADLSSLKPIVDSLLQKALMVELTPAGRGQVVSHNLYLTPEMERLKSEAGRGGAGGDSSKPASSRPQTSSSSAAGSSDPALAEQIRGLREELAALRTRVEQLESRLD